MHKERVQLPGIKIVEQLLEGPDAVRSSCLRLVRTAMQKLTCYMTNLCCIMVNLELVLHHPHGPKCFQRG
jgi:hypothetical protein